MKFVFKLVINGRKNEIFNINEKEILLKKICELEKQGLIGYEDFYTDIIRKEQTEG